ncbi:MAG: SBBP repeat-containing protein [Bryobacterales bacterium]|nr:SBBP repeat-containing protein [Bryobacterales bacterium]
MKSLALLTVTLAAAAAAGQPSTSQRAHRALLERPVVFEANHGQASPEVKFMARAPGIGLALTASEVLIHLGDRPSALRMRFAGARRTPRVEGLALQPGRSNYILGSRASQWYTDVPNFGKVAYLSLYPGIDLVFYGASPQHLEYDFIVAPDADPSAISIAFEGADSLSLDGEGTAILRAGETELRQRKPRVYQTIGGREVPVDGRFVLQGRNRLGFAVAKYDPRHALIIDPVMVYASLIGGPSSYDEGWGIAVDPTGAAYITGRVYGTGFPVVGGVATSGAAFVTKINPAGTAIVYSTYISGTDGYGATAIAVDAAGSAYITGQTGWGFSATPGAAQSTGGFFDAYVLKLNPAGNALVYSTYLGGSGADRGFGIAVDSSGAAYVTGETSSSDFPLVSPVQTVPGGDADAFVTKVNSTGSAFLYSTRLGGNGQDVSAAVAVDSSGRAVITGLTASSTFPVSNAIQPTFGGYYDIFVARLSASGSSLDFSTYLGGSWWENAGNSIAFDAAGNIWIAGTSGSPNFPLVSPLQASNQGGDDVVLFALNPAGSALVYSTYIGGTNYDRGAGVAVLPAGDIAVVGSSYSSDFPTVSPLQSTLAGYNDAVVLVLNRLTNTLSFSTYWGGPYQDWAFNIADDSIGNIYFTGVGESSAFPVQDQIPLPPMEGFNAFVGKIDGPNLTVSSLVSNLPLPSSSSPLRLTATVANIGTVAHSAVNLRIFLDTNSDGLLSAGEASSQTTIAGLAVGATSTVTLSFASPPGGTYPAVAMVDPTNAITESNETDNAFSLPISVARPDYTVTGLSTSVAAAGAPGRFNVSLNATVANIGLGAAPNVQIRFSVSSDGGITYSDIGGPVSAGSIAAGSSSIVTATFRNATAGSYSIRISADPNDVILEINETNNTAVFPLVVP